MFSAPAPKNTNTPAVSVANHGRTPARRMTVRRSNAVTRCSVMMSSWYGTYVRIPKTHHSNRYARIGSVTQCW